MLRDVEYFKSKIGGLDGAGDAGDYIVGLIKGKSVLKPKAPVIEIPSPKRDMEKESTIANGKTSIESPAEVPAAVEEKGKKEQPTHVEEKAS